MRVVQGIKDIYGENLTETVGTTHNYLGMTFDYLFTKEVRINMWDYLRKVIKGFPKEITGVCAHQQVITSLRCGRMEGN